MELSDSLCLGIDVPVTAILTKLRIRKTDSTFEISAATEERDKPMQVFGKLIVCLPYLHEGGEVHLLHNGQQNVHNTSKTARFGLSALAWYADVTHEFKPISSGFRVLVEYHLEHEPQHAVYTTELANRVLSRGTIRLLFQEFVKKPSWIKSP